MQSSGQTLGQKVRFESATGWRNGLEAGDCWAPPCKRVHCGKGLEKSSRGGVSGRVHATESQEESIKEKSVRCAHFWAALGDCLYRAAL